MMQNVSGVDMEMLFSMTSLNTFLNIYAFWLGWITFGNESTSATASEASHWKELASEAVMFVDSFAAVLKGN